MNLNQIGQMPFVCFILRFLSFLRFTLEDYFHSKRILIEVFLTFAFLFLLFNNKQPFLTGQFFGSVGAFSLALTLFTVSSVLSQGDQPAGYLLLIRRLDRTSYLLGLYFCALLLILLSFCIICAATFFLKPPSDLNFANFIVRTIPLVLNVGLVGAFLLLLTPMVLSTGWRLLLLSLLALAFSSSFVSGYFLQTLPKDFVQILSGMQALLSYPLLPILRGFALMLEQRTGTPEFTVLITQGALLAIILLTAIYSFRQRELTFLNE